MEEAPTPTTLFPKEEIISETLEIKQDKDIYKLNIKIEDEIMFFKIIEQEPIILGYSTKYSLNEIKNINQTFTLLKSCNQFLDYLKALVSQSKIMIQKNIDEKYLIISFETEYLYEKFSIQIKLYPEKLDIEANISHLFEQMSNLKKEIKLFENENKTIKEEQNKLNEENVSLKEINKSLEDKINNIMKEVDYKTINDEINDLKNILNIKSNEIKKLEEENNNLKKQIENEVKIIK